MRSQSLLFLLFALAVSTGECINSEGDALFEWKIALTDPNNVLQSWDPTLPNPCTWFHVSCNSQNSVTRLDLGNARLSGTLVPQLGLLTNLQYLAAFSNNISGPIPMELGNLTKLLSLELNDNQLTGSIPSTLANLKYLRFLRLNGNRLTGKIPSELVGLLYYGNLSIMNVSDNYLAGTVRATNPTMFAVTTIVQDPRP